MFRLFANPDLDSHCGSPFRSSTYVDEPFISTHHFIALCPSLDSCNQGYRGMPAPWQDTPIIRPFGSNINDYSMRVQSSVYTAYVVGCFCLRQSGTSFLLVFGFPRYARKNRTQRMGSTILPQAEAALNAGDCGRLRQLAFERHCAA